MGVNKAMRYEEMYKTERTKSGEVRKRKTGQKERRMKGRGWKLKR
jgi:hypothetical protein